jgi:hypothetical protein
MSELITESQVEIAVKSNIQEAYGVGAGYPFNLYEDELYRAFHEFALSQGIQDTAELKVGLRDLAELCANTLRSHVDSPVFRIMSETLRFRPALFMGIIVSLVAALIFTALIFGINRRVTKRIDGYLYALSAVSLICAGLPIVFFGTRLTARLNITPLSYNRFLSSWLDGIVSGYLSALIPLIILTGICITVRIIRKNRYGHRY